MVTRESQQFRGVGFDLCGFASQAEPLGLGDNRDARDFKFAGDRSDRATLGDPALELEGVGAANGPGNPSTSTVALVMKTANYIYTKGI